MKIPTIPTILALAALLLGAPRAFPQSPEPIVLEWKGSVHRLDAPIPIQIKTRDQDLSKKIHASGIVVKGSDGLERRLRSSAKETKPRNDSGQWIIEVDAMETNNTAPPGKIEVLYEMEDGHRSKALYGTLVSPVQQPMVELKKNPTKLAALIETDDGNILVELRGDKAPKTVANFVKLVADGFYDGKTFHRVYRGFVIQGGAYKPDGTQTDSEKIPFEDSGLPHDRGVISMARLPDDKNSASCQFFFCLTPHRNQFDGNYASFGKIVEGCGLEAMDRIALTPVEPAANNEKSKPRNPPVMRRVSIVEKP
jgi:peptidyl-prolyl cis-trans isomerase B (cyclophilin B)